MKKNKGYTLVEMLIVLAIMAILTGLSVITIDVINKAKYNAGVTSFDNQLSSLWIKTKALSQAKKQTTPTSGTPKAIYPLCMQLIQNADDTYSVIYGFYTDIGFTQGEASGTVSEIKAGSLSVDKKEDKAIGLQATLPDILTISYTPSDASQASRNSGDKMYIEFVKSDGSVKYGAGTYTITYKDGQTVTKVYLDPVTGKHYIK